VGFITRGRGLTVHARDCLTVAKSVLDRERLIDVEWDVAEPAKRPVKVAVYIGRDRPGLLAEITGAISSRNGNITKAEVTVTDDRRGINHFVIEVADLGIEPPDTLYGLYRGVDLTHRDSSYGNVLPDTVTIYQGPIEEDCADEEEMAELVRETVIHELGHYFGLDDETMERIEDSDV